MDIDNFQRQQNVLLRRRRAQETQLPKLVDVSAEGKAKAARQIVDEYNAAVAKLKAAAESDVQAERERLDKVHRAKQVEGIKRQRELFNQLPASEVLLMQATLAGSTPAELAQWYDGLALDPPAALGARLLLAAHLKSADFEPKEMIDVGRLQRRIDEDQAAMAADLVKVEAELNALKSVEKQVAELDSIARRAALEHRYSIGGGDGPAIPDVEDLTRAELNAAHGQLATMIGHALQVV